jgi:CBS domain-containing protein
VWEIMTREVVTVSPEMSVESVVELMLQNGLSRVPVVDAKGKLVGIVSKTDLVTEHFQRGDTSESHQPAQIPLGPGTYSSEPGMHIHLPEAVVSELMKPATITVKETDPVSKAAEAMAVHHMHGLPVVSLTGKVTGMLSPLDIVGWVAGLI